MIVLLKGGLGNQMFQYAVARGIQKKDGAILLDLHYLLSNNNPSGPITPRNYELKIFKNLNVSLLTGFKKDLFHNTSLFYKLLRKVYFVGLNRIVQSGNDFVPLKKQDGYLDGFFQSEKHFMHIRPQLLREFEFPQLDETNVHILNKINEATNAISLHIRRGDYLSKEANTFHGILPLSYYLEAVKKIEERIANPSYFIFSDDLEWCKSNLNFIEEKCFVAASTDSSTAWKDMYLMTQCRHHIVANSSFSWWGAWLSQRQGFTFAPYRWFNPDFVKFNIADFIPASWEVLHY